MRVQPKLPKPIRDEEGEKIQRVDVVCMYPYICKHRKFVSGPTKEYVGADCPLTVWTGRVYQM